MREIFLRQTNQTWVNASLAVIVNHKSEELQKLLIDVNEAEGYEEENRNDNKNSRNQHSKLL